MKRVKKSLVLLCLLVLIGCGQQPPDPPEAETETLRIVDGAGTDRLLLAGASAEEVYLLSMEGVQVLLDGKAAGADALADGMTAEVAVLDRTDGFPSVLTASAVSVHSRGSREEPCGERYDLAGLWLRVLDDLWEEDAGLNGGVSMVSVDLSRAPGGLTEGEQSAVVWAFAEARGIKGLSMNWKELEEQGYLRPFGPDGTEWPDGVLLTITAWDDDGLYSLPTVHFSAEKRRSPLGVYILEDCRTVWPECGTWSGYTVGREAIA